jgi:isopropylmalate/homocitrate/citramalate synthase
MSVTPQRVTVVEVGPRDGLQNEPARLPAAAKIAFVDDLSRAGFPVIEVAAFVSPKWVPQMADAAEVCAGITKRPGTRYSALVPNLPGLERAHAAGMVEVAVFAASSESFSRRNINQSIDESLETYRAVCSRARALGIRVRGYLSTAFGCPFEGAVDPQRVADVAAALIEMGAFEVSVSDTIGIAHPGQVPRVVGAVADRIGLERIALHFHDTRGTALANVLAALNLGVATYDASAGGLGGCPYAPGATGNLASEDLLYMLNGLGIETGINLGLVVEASARLAEHVGHAPVSRYFRAARAARPSSSPTDPHSSN